MDVFFLNNNNNFKPKFQTVFYSENYLSSHVFDKLFAFYDNNFSFICSIDNNVTTSLSKCLFGSFWFNEIFVENDFAIFLVKLKEKLKELEILEVFIRHPPYFYPNQVSVKSLFKNDSFKLCYSDTNQFIVLDNWSEKLIHKMEQRKLKSLENDFQFKKLTDDFLPTIHHFISKCRQNQGISINISLKQLLKTQKNTEGMYECFGVYYKNTLTCACITAKITEDIIYYYLPATSPDFKKNSPMVLLLTKMCKYYQQRNFSIFDLGISSIKGEVQEGLSTFKKNLGARSTEKHFIKFMV